MREKKSLPEEERRDILQRRRKVPRKRNIREEKEDDGRTLAFAAKIISVEGKLIPVSCKGRNTFSPLTRKKIHFEGAWLQEK